MSKTFETILENSFRDINQSVQSDLDPEFYQSTYDEIEFVHFFEGDEPKSLFKLPKTSKGIALTIGWAYYADDIYTSMPCSDYWMEIRIAGEAFAVVNCYNMWIGKEEVECFYSNNEENDDN